jgi:hypothetical protein
MRVISSILRISVPHLENIETVKKVNQTIWRSKEDQTLSKILTQIVRSLTSKKRMDVTT